MILCAILCAMQRIAMVFLTRWLQAFCLIPLGIFRPIKKKTTKFKGKMNIIEIGDEKHIHNNTTKIDCKNICKKLFSTNAQIVNTNWWLEFKPDKWKQKREARRRILKREKGRKEGKKSNININERTNQVSNADLFDSKEKWDMQTQTQKS